MSDKRVLTASMVIDSFTRNGPEIIKLCEPKKAASGKESTVTYFETKILAKNPKTDKDEWLLPKLMFNGITICGCKAPELRKNGAKPTYAFYMEDVDKKGEEVGKACKIIADAWERAINKWKVANSVELTDPVYKTNKMYMIATKADPLKGVKSVAIHRGGMMYIKLRSKSMSDITHRGNLTILTSKTTSRTKSASGQPFNEQNLHEDVRSGAIATGIIAFDTTTLSSQGFANGSESLELYLTVPDNRRADTSGLDMSLLMDAIPDSAPAPTAPAEASSSTDDRQSTSDSTGGIDQSALDMLIGDQ